MAKQYTHELVIRVRFDKKCTKTHALASVRDCIHGDHYPHQPDIDNDPGVFTVKSFKGMPRKPRDVWTMS